MRPSKIALMHIPKTGGTVLADMIFRQTRADDAFLFSFFGLDGSDGANRLTVESLHEGDARLEGLLRNRHFLESRVITGHFSYDLRRLLCGFSLQFATVLREPVDRGISQIYQYAREWNDRCFLGIYDLSSKIRRTDAFWDEIGWILNRHRGEPIPGLFPHENIMLSDAMCQLIGGARLDRIGPPVAFERAVANLPSFKVALFEQFNETCAALMAELGLPVTLDAGTNPYGEGRPPSRLGQTTYHGAPAKVVDLVRERNQDDVRLYEHVVANRLYVTARRSP